MRELLELSPYVSAQIQSVNRIIKESLSSNSKHLAGPRDHLLESRGKGLRPVLVILWSSAWRKAGTREETSIAPVVAEIAAAVELIHMASLVHDDLIDGSATRRGVETLNARFGARPSVLIGDFLFARAFQLLARHKELGVLELMTNAISAMCEGELDQAACSFSCSETEEAYLRRITQKTASLLAASCHAGAAIGGASAEEIVNARTYGLELGIAFQLTDDALDFVADPQELGKPTCQDLVCGVLSLPVLRLLAHEVLGPKAREVIESRRFDPESVSWVRNAVLECGGIDYAYERARHSLTRAAACAARLPASPSQEALTAIAQQLITRRR